MMTAPTPFDFPPPHYQYCEENPNSTNTRRFTPMGYAYNTKVLYGGRDGSAVALSIDMCAAKNGGEDVLRGLPGGVVPFPCAAQ
jgi:hypothetical protein